MVEKEREGYEEEEKNKKKYKNGRVLMLLLGSD